MIPDHWEDLGIGLLQQADCMRGSATRTERRPLRAPPNDFWAPGVSPAPTGDKLAVAEKLKVIVAEARRE
jgi:hypothetical protein